MKAKGIYSALIITATALFLLPFRAAAEQKEPLVTLDCQAAPLPEVLRGISQIAGVDIIFGSELTEKVVTAKLDKVPWEEALEVIMDYQGDYVCLREGNLVRVKLRAKEEVRPESLETAVISLSFARASDLKKSEVLQKLVEGGKIENDEQTNSLVVIARSSKILEIKELVKKLDIAAPPIPQIMIEGYILETNSSYLRNIGVNWDLSPVKLLGPPVDKALNLTPLQKLHSDVGGEFSVGYMDAGTFLATIQFLESKTDTRILSRPKIATVNNKEAKINVGKEIPVQTTSTVGGVVQTALVFKETGVSLTVTPTMNGDEDVALKILTEVSDISGYTPNNDPIIATSYADTNVRVRNGQTVVIAGLMKQSRPYSVSGLPFLRNIPILKWFFGQEQIGDNESRELVFFISPQVIREWKAEKTPSLAATPSAGSGNRK